MEIGKLLAAVSLLAFGGAATLVVAQGGSQQPSQAELETARAEIDKANKAWAKARSALDRDAMDKLLGADFEVNVDGEKTSRKEFLDQCVTPMNNAKIVRLELDILTVQRKKNGEWQAILMEKMDIDRTGPDGKTTRTYALWIARDSFREAPGTWLCTYSEGSGFEAWGGGKKPPLKNW